MLAMEKEMETKFFRKKTLKEELMKSEKILKEQLLS